MEKISKKKTTKTKAVEERREKKQRIAELNKNKNDISVEVTNISYMGCKYGNRRGDIYFDLMPNETAILTLGELYEICSGDSIKFFRNSYIVITDVYTEGINMDDVTSYLGLDSIYKNIEDPHCDFIEELLTSYDDEDFENIVKSRDINFIRTVACKAIYMNNSEMYDFKITREQDKILSNRLGKRTLFELED